MSIVTGTLLIVVLCALLIWILPTAPFPTAICIQLWVDVVMALDVKLEEQRICDPPVSACMADWLSQTLLENGWLHVVVPEFSAFCKLVIWDEVKAVPLISPELTIALLRVEILKSALLPLIVPVTDHVGSNQTSCPISQTWSEFA